MQRACPARQTICFIWVFEVFEREIMVMEVVHEDMGEGTMGCVNHQYKNSTPGGICAFCLQEKLGKLVSSSFPAAVFPPSSSSSTPSFRSDFGGGSTASSATTLQDRHFVSSSSTHSQFVNYIDTTRGKESSSLGYATTRSRLPFSLTHRTNKQKDEMMVSDSNSIIFKRSKSTTTPIRAEHFLAENEAKDYTNRTRFWSLLYMPKHCTKRTAMRSKALNFSSATPKTLCGSSVSSSGDQKKEDIVVVYETENGSPGDSAFDRKVSRSRSVGCGSRSFSGDFFEKISTGFGDCTLRRVESQREAKPKTPSVHKIGVTERVKCGGIFSGFTIPSSSSSSSTDDRSISVTHSSTVNLSHGKIRSWGWALASPMRVFGKLPSTSKSIAGSSKNVTPNSAAIPSLLSM